MCQYLFAAMRRHQACFIISVLWMFMPWACLSQMPTTGVNIENEILHISYELEHWLDIEKQPCQDFISYVCARSLNSSQSLKEKRLELEQQRFDKFLSTDNEQLLDAELKVKQFYEACRNARSSEDLKSSFMYRQSGGWPAIDDTISMIRKRRNMTWLSVLTAFHDIGTEYFFKVDIEIKSNKRIFYMQPNEAMRFTLRKFEHSAEEVMQEYNVDGGKARLVALETLNFERNRREIIKTDKNRDEMVELTLEQFKANLFSSSGLQAEWDAYFKKILGKALKANDVIYIRNLPKMKELFDLLQKTTITRLLNWIWIDYLMDKSAADCQTLVQNYFGAIYEHIAEHVGIDKIQMAQMYSDIGKAYDELLPPSKWIDEISQQNSKQFLGKIMHITLNGDEKLDENFKSLTVTKRNFYRDMEKVQRFLKSRKFNSFMSSGSNSNSRDTTAMANEFLQVFLTINTLMHQHNLSAPLSYALVGERFAEYMIASGSSSSIPGAWRSMDSEREYNTFQQCIVRQTSVHTASDGANIFGSKFNTNNLILKLLAQQQTLKALQHWQLKNYSLMRRLDDLLEAGRLQLSFKRLYFIGTLLSDCQQFHQSEQIELMNTYLRNSMEFAQAFNCRPDDFLATRNLCKLMP